MRGDFYWKFVPRGDYKIDIKNKKITKTLEFLKNSKGKIQEGISD